MERDLGEAANRTLAGRDLTKSDRDGEMQVFHLLPTAWLYSTIQIPTYNVSSEIAHALLHSPGPGSKATL